MNKHDSNPAVGNAANDESKIAVAGRGKGEYTKRSLHHIRQVYHIKSRHFGSLYDLLGEIVWQIVCEIYCYNTDGKLLSRDKLAQSLSISTQRLQRYLDILKLEQLLEDEGYPNALALSAHGVTLADDILEDSMESFREKFIYSRPTAV